MATSDMGILISGQKYLQIVPQRRGFYLMVLSSNNKMEVKRK